MNIEELLEQIDKGLAGNPDFVPVGAHPITGDYGGIADFVNFGKRFYVLFGGMPGSGKTAMVDYLFVIGMYKQWLREKKTKPFFIYRSMERSSVWKMAKWTSLLMFLDHGILIDVPTLLSMPAKMRDLAMEDRKKVESYTEFWEEFNKHMVMRSGTVTVNEARHELEDIMHMKGDFIKTVENYIFINGQNVGDWNEMPVDDTYDGIEMSYYEYKGQKVYKGEKKFFPYDEDELVIYITDHIGKYMKEAGKSDHSTIDAHADMVADARDLYGLGVVDISQFNREVHDTYRKVKTTLSVSEKDFRGCSKPYHNCDVAIGMLDPYSLDLGTHAGYYLKSFISERGHCRFRDMKIVKNNWGPDGVSVGLCFFGENGYIHELPTDPGALDDHQLEAMVSGINLF